MGERVTRWTAWVDEGTAHLDRLLALTPDAALTQASLLPGWTRAHVLAHVARNADALINLLTWARTGVETPMYHDPDERAEGIASDSRRPGGVIKADVAESGRRFRAAVDAMAPTSWGVPVRTIRGRTLPAVDILWLRVRELWVHSLDLATGDSATDFPPALIDALLEESVAYFSSLPACPPMLLRRADGSGTSAVGDTEGAAVATVTGSPPDLLTWLIGRSDGTGLASDAPLPPLPPWI